MFHELPSATYRYSRAAKLLMALGYGNFDTVIQYDIYAMAERYVADGKTRTAALNTKIDKIIR